MNRGLLATIGRVLLILLFSVAAMTAYSQEAYDPFVDYSEYEEPEKEKEDVQFFQHGRFVTLSFIVGYNTMTDLMSEYVAPGNSFGVALGFFFDLRFSMQLSFWSSDHSMKFKTNNGNEKSLSASFDDIGLHLKYHLNTQNLTKGLAFLNPYLILGIGRMTRTFQTDAPELGKTSATAAEGGVGLEIPLLRGKMYLGVQAMYHLVGFSDEESEQVIDSETKSGIFFRGDLISGMAHVGINF